ncbi:hypothetical protein ACIO3O_30235 [Streptomyces sp. NPDC087440]|uniref:hypothetical protein n=1 Tax=Streptomyces sp. NPDC087440 TaxID=3365790 RepID=UPI003814F199
MHEQSVRVPSRQPLADADGDWARLHGDCARMVPHWAVPATVTESVPASLIHGVVVPSASARLVGAMPEYGA